MRTYNLKNYILIVLWIVLFPLIISSLAVAQSSQITVEDKPYTVEYYYKAKWGYADEFIQLYKKNHYPVMKKEQELGRILSLTNLLHVIFSTNLVDY